MVLEDGLGFERLAIWPKEKDGSVFTQPFCTACGTFQAVKQTPIPDAPESALQFRNPIQFKNKIPTQGTEVGLSTQLSTRARFEASVKGSVFTNVALEQYEMELEPLVTAGRVDGAFVDMVAQYWERSALLVEHFKKLMHQCKDSGKEYGRQAPLFEKLNEWGASTAKVAMRGVVTDGSSYQLHLRALEFEFALGQCQQAAYRLASFIRLQKAKHLAGDSFETRLMAVTVGPVEWIRRVKNQYEERLEAELWLPDREYASQVLTRLEELSKQMTELIEPNVPLTILEWEQWLPAKSLALWRDIWLAVDTRMHIHETVEKVEQSIEEKHQAWRDKLEDILSDVQDQQASEERRADRVRAAQDQGAMVSRLVHEQQIARQMSEGKYGAALITAYIGTHAGATIEGAVKK